MGRFPDDKPVRSWQMQPLAVAVLSALTPPEWKRTFYDDRMEEIDYDRATDLAAISVEAYTARRAYQITAEFRKRGVPVVMGGYHPTSCPEEVLEHADAIVIGEAEGVWRRLLDDVIGRILQATYQGPPAAELKNITPDRSIYEGKNYFFITLVETGRGCRFKCEFCAVSAFYKATYRRRDIPEIVAELKRIGKKFIFFVDDNIIGDTASAKELFRAIKPLGIKWVSQGSLNAAADPELMRLMAESGCQGILVGFESLAAGNIAAVGKAVNRDTDYAAAVAAFRDHGIMLYGTFMFGLPGDTPELAAQTVDFAVKNKIWIAAFAHIVPFPGTPLYRRCQAEGRLLYDKWWLSAGYRFGQTPFEPWSMTATELEELCFQSRRRFFSWSSIISRARDLKANCRNPVTAALYFGANVLMHRELPHKAGQPLGLQQPDRRAAPAARGKLAAASDDARIRRLLHRTPVPGMVEITYLREPSFLEALAVEGRVNQAFIGIDGASDDVIGVASRSIKTAYIDGEPGPLGYLSTLRVAAEYRGGTFLARGYRFLKDLHADGAASLYLTTIIEGNEKARRLLTSGRGGLPAYHDLGRFHTLAISLRQRRKHATAPGIAVRTAETTDIPLMLNLWRCEGSKKLFFPEYRANDFGASGGLLRGLNIADISLAFDGGELVGTAAAWDQKEFRQSKITGYARPLGMARPVYNLVARALGYPTLPPVGTVLPYVNLSLVCVKGDDPQIFGALLEDLVRWSKGNHTLLMAGCHERDPLLQTLRRYRHFRYDSRLYAVCWPDGEAAFQKLGNRVPYVELGSL
jgi:radical SAM superfamily enzyme YgiQ (UPF0313 family)